MRPSRYYVTRDNVVVMASEVGVYDVDPADVVHKGRLKPGRMLLVDTAEHLKQAFVPGLHAHADPVDPELPEAGRLFKRHRGGVHLQGPFPELAEIEPCPEAREEIIELGGA